MRCLTPLLSSARGRTKPAGHPGGPPPAPTRKKRRKHSYTHRFVGEEPLSPELHLPAPRSENRKQDQERYTRQRVARARRFSRGCEERGESSGDDFHPGVRSLSPRDDGLSCCSVPAPVVNARSCSPEFSSDGPKIDHAERRVRAAGSNDTVNAKGRFRESRESNAVAHTEGGFRKEAEPSIAAAAAVVCTTMKKSEPHRRATSTRSNDELEERRRATSTRSSDEKGSYERAIATERQAGGGGGRQDFALIAAGGSKRTRLIRVRGCRSDLQSVGNWRSVAEVDGSRDFIKIPGIV